MAKSKSGKRRVTDIQKSWKKFLAEPESKSRRIND